MRIFYESVDSTHRAILKVYKGRQLRQDDPLSGDNVIDLSRPAWGDPHKVYLRTTQPDFRAFENDKNLLREYPLDSSPSALDLLINVLGETLWMIFGLKKTNKWEVPILSEFAPDKRPVVILMYSISYISTHVLFHQR